VNIALVHMDTPVAEARPRYLKEKWVEVVAYVSIKTITV
jgi:hypothetical protein